MGIENKLLKIERDAQKVVRLANIGAKTAVKLDLNETDIKIINNKGTVVSTYTNVGRKKREEANLAASALDIAKPDDAPHIIESKSAITFKEDGTIDFGDASFGDLFPTAEVERMIYDIEFYTDCENIKQFIKDHTKVLEDQIKASAPELANLAAINGLMSFPSNPLKIISWVRKVVSKFFGPYTLAMIDLAIQLAMFASALARLASAASAAQQNLKLCAYEIKEDAVDSVLETINEKIAGAVADIDKVVDAVSEAQTAIGKVTGKPPNFLPSSLQGGVSGLVQNLTDETRADILARGNSASAIPVQDRTPQQVQDVANLENQRKQDELDRTELISKMDNHLAGVIPGLDLPAAKAVPDGKVATPSSVKEFTANIDEVVARPFDQDPQAQADLDAFANTAASSLEGNSQFGTTLLTSAGAFAGDVTIPGAVSGGTGGNFEIITGKGSFDQVRYIVSGGIITDVQVGL
ncbi:MAG: hypothetical protein CMK23_05905 [Porticoccaceae bacterium]|nr:hypothetical protein [Porticoccaceae bacterium]